MYDGIGICSVCARVCHKDHEVSYAKYSSFFCDCGAKDDGTCQVEIYVVELFIRFHGNDSFRLNQTNYNFCEIILTLFFTKEHVCY